MTPLTPPPESPSPPTAVRDVRLTASPALGAIPLAFIRNQFQYCSVICPHAVQGAITVPIAAAQTPVTFLGSLASSGSLFKAIGAAAASVTGPANAAADPIITNDLSLVLPKAQHALNVAIVEAFNVGAAASRPGEFIQAVETARSRILDALNQPMGPPTTPTGAQTIWQVVAVEAVNVASAVLFQAGELLLLGVVQTADAVAQELAQSGDPAAALAAGAAQAGQVIGEASSRVVTAVDTAATNIRNSLADPFPSTTAQTTTTVNDEPAKPDSDKPTEKRSDKKDSDGEVPREADEQSEDKPKDVPEDEPQSDAPGGADEDKPKDEPQSDAPGGADEDNSDKKDDARVSD